MEAEIGGMPPQTKKHQVPKEARRSKEYTPLEPSNGMPRP